MARRIMLPFVVDIYPLAVLAEDAVILGAGSEPLSNDNLTVSSPQSMSTSQCLEFASLERTVSDTHRTHIGQVCDT